jgi:cbb3-type cytochrome oxidase subunit 3
MLKFIKHHLDTISGIELYPMLSFVVFFLFFITMLLWLVKVSRRHIDHMSALPLGDDAPQAHEHHAH